MNLVDIYTVGNILYEKVLNSQLFVAAIGSASGAFGGAWAIWKIDQKAKLEKKLSKINSGIVLIANATTTLINLKRIVLPMHDEIIELKKKFDSPETDDAGKKLLKFDHSLKYIIEPQINLDLNFNFLCDYATINPNALMICQKAIDSIIEVKNIIHKRNQIVEKIASDPLDIRQKAQKYLGMQLNKGEIDDSLYSFTEGLKYRVDVSIFFANKANTEFRNVGLKIMPKKWQNKIVKVEILNPEDKKLVPTEDLIGY